MLSTTLKKNAEFNYLKIAHFFEVGAKLGSGAFGDVYEGQDVRTGARVAIKTESVDAECPQLVYESRVMQELQSAPGIPRNYWFGKEGGHNVLIMQRLGRCLGGDEGEAMDLASARHIASEALLRLQTLHAAGLAHRDIKPENFVFGIGANKTVLYIIDFGLCKRVVDPSTGCHIDHRHDKQMTGTPRYASLRMHAGEEQSRRDDVESLGYMLVFLIKGALPWQGLPSKNNYKAMADVKRSTSLPDLCASLPPAFESLISYARHLEFSAMPDYRLLLSMFAAA